MKKEKNIVLIIFILTLLFLQTVSFAENEDVILNVVSEEILSNEILEDDIVIDEIVNEVEDEIIEETVEEEIETEVIEENIDIAQDEVIIQEEEIQVLETTISSEVVSEDVNVLTTEENDDADSNYASVYYRTHAQNVGWQKTFKDGETAGTVGRGLRLEAMEITLDSNLSGSVKYQSYVQNIGWQAEKKDGEESGTNGRGLRLEALRISLEGEIAEYYDIYYRVHAQNVGWLDWAKNGADAGTAGYGFRLEGIEIVLVKKGEDAPGSTAKPFKEKVYPVYRSHVQNIGWQSYVANGALSGTSGLGLRVEGMNIKIQTTQLSGDVVYSAYVQQKGWLSEVKNGGYAGTSNEGLRMEAIKMNLTGELAEKYDIYYRVHAQQFGWLGWAKNGEAAGTIGINYRLEGIQIKLVAKGGSAPGSTNNTYRERVEFVVDNMPNNRVTLNVGNTFTVEYHTALDCVTNKTPRFEALNPTIAIIDSNGKITAVSSGIANFVMYDASGYMTAGFYVIVN